MAASQYLYTLHAPHRVLLQVGLLTFIPSARLMLEYYHDKQIFFQATPHDFVTTGAVSRCGVVLWCGVARRGVLRCGVVW